MRNPNYAIVKIPERANVVGFYQLLLEHGFCEVSFVNEVRENAFLPHSELGESSTTNMAGASKHSEPMQRLAMSNSESGNDRRNLGNGSGISNTAFGSNSGRTSALLPDPMRTRIKQPSSQPPDQFRVGNRPLSNAVSPVMSPFGYGSTNTARPRGMRTNAIQASNASQSGESATDEPIYATCQLCQNKIMSTRLSNLTNHVRRHAAMKQYQCKHCSYSHNEMAKVRLHMQHNHQDFASQPHDAICYEMQLQWGLLMEQCFPEHAKRFGPSATTIQSRELDQNQDQYVNTQNVYTCVECGEMVEGSGLAEHLHEAHRRDCVPYGCSDCNFMSAAPSSVRLHISMKHSDRVGDASVNPLPPGTNYTPFFHRFFPEIPKEEEECKVGDFIKQRLTKQQSDRNVNRDESPLEETITCEMCDGSVLSCKSMTGLLEHAKRHYVVKQFRCPDCTHACVDISSMRTHISIKHPGSESEPIDLLSEDLQVAWVDTMKKCFPHLHDRIEEFATSELNPQALSNMGDPPSVSKSQTETAEEFEESTASASPISASSSANLDNNGRDNGSGMHSNQICKEGRNSDAQGPMYDVQFDDSGVISKIRAAKRQHPHSQNDVEDEHGEAEDSREQNQPYESARHKLRSGKLRHVSAEDYNQEDEQAYSPTVRTTRNSARRQQ